MRPRTVVILAALAGCAAPSADRESPVEAPPPPAPDKACSDGFEALSAEAGCVPVHATSACAAGTRAAIGAAACVPVGTTACAPGFAPDPTGWGCDAVIAPASCASGSGTRERLGVTGCVAISDCSAPYPPAGATLLVDASYADAQLDGTHFRTIGEAVAAAPASATIAVEAGTYVEKLVLTGRAITIAGRCAEKVIVKQAEGVIGSGIDVASGDDVTLRNLTFRGYRTAVSIDGGKTKLDSVVLEDGLNAGIVAANEGTDVRLKNVVIRGMKVKPGAPQGFGILATFGANVVIEDSVVSGNEFVNVAVAKIGTKLLLSRSIVRDGKGFGPSAAYGMGVYVGESGSATVEESAIVDNAAEGLDVYAKTGEDSTGVLRRSVVRRTKLNAALGVGRGIEVTGSHFTMEQSTVGGSAQMELFASDGATAQISDSTIVGGPPEPGLKQYGSLGLITDSATIKARSLAIVSVRAGGEVQGTGTLELESSLVQGTRLAKTAYDTDHWIGVGIFVESKASLVLAKSTLQDTHTASLLVVGKADISDSLVHKTRAGLDGLGGRGLSVQNGGAATVSRSGFVDNEETGVIVMLGGSSLTMTGSTVQDTAFDRSGKFGIGLLVGNDAVASIDSTTITGSKGVGLAVAAAGATVRRGAISRNAIGVNAQSGTELREGDAILDARSLMISKDTRFIENETRVGSGAVPLPAPILGPKAR